MWLLLTYIGLAVVGNAIIYFIGLALNGCGRWQACRCSC